MLRRALEGKDYAEFLEFRMCLLEAIEQTFT